ncbi:putative Serine/arginine rich splicing factor [Zostera marina]|uniref:Putative Serine/arginine rich splicing factor n=1 Tax=Zostera marina TaxID=29655 RepID=A0A0K9PVN8_ZOSMR|nr:putative Serine/arginine rich splicing factor [Zostera marina]
MRRYSPPYHSPPRRGGGYSGRDRSPPRRRGYGGGGGGGGYGGRREQNNGSLLVRNIPLNARTEDLRDQFERFGPVRDVYIPKNYYSGEPRGFAFVQFFDPYEASEAQYHMNGQIFGGREITVVVASESRKRPEEMRTRDRNRGSSYGHEGRHSSHYGRSRSRSPRRPYSSSRRRSRSYSPAPKRHDDYSVSPPRRHSSHRSRSPIDHQRERDEDVRRSYSPDYEGAASRKHDVNRRSSYDEEKSLHVRSPRRASVSPPGSRSRSVDLSPRRSRSP